MSSLADQIEAHAICREQVAVILAERAYAVRLAEHNAVTRLADWDAANPPPTGDGWLRHQLDRQAEWRAACDEQRAAWWAAENQQVARVKEVLSARDARLATLRAAMRGAPKQN